MIYNFASPWRNSTQTSQTTHNARWPCLITKAASTAGGGVTNMMQYSHLLIATPRSFAPSASQVVRLYRALDHLGSAPLCAKLRGRTPSGKTRTMTNPFTRASYESPIMDCFSFESLDEAAAKIAALDNYVLTMDGRGPPAKVPLPFDFDDEYDYAIHCKVHREPVTTSDPHDDPPNAPRHGRVCVQKGDLGIFRNPTTMEIMEVPGGACARFWIEFEFGKELFPTVGETLDLLDRRIVEAAVEVFNAQFAQGCFWG
jgi:hypothetical protein